MKSFFHGGKYFVMKMSKIKAKLVLNLETHFFIEDSLTQIENTQKLKWSKRNPKVKW